MFKFHNPQNAFTLAELLICLAILAALATFTIPKILALQENTRYNAIVKEAAAMVSGAYSIYSLQNGVNPNTKFSNLTPYMNYTSVDTSTTFDFTYGQTTRTCDTLGVRCLKLHNGALLQFGNGNTDYFGGTATTNGIYFVVDPDGRNTDGTTNGPGKATEFWLYYNGGLTTKAKTLPQVCNGTGCYIPTGTEDPPYWDW
jgi:prepilin-type N-terminal cleavage/methylation domain-containing protein